MKKALHLFRTKKTDLGMTFSLRHDTMNGNVRQEE